MFLHGSLAKALGIQQTALINSVEEEAICTQLQSYCKESKLLFLLCYIWTCDVLPAGKSLGGWELLCQAGYWGLGEKTAPSFLLCE